MGRQHFWYILATCTFFTSCSQTNALLDPYAFAPCLPNAMWNQNTHESCLISSEYFSTYLPKDFADKELSLAELIDIALYNNPTTKTSWAEARSKAATYAKTQSAYLPKVDATYQYLRDRSTFSLSESVTIPYLLTTYGPEVNVSYTLLDFGQRQANSESALQGLLFADLSHNRTIQTAMQRVMDDYYDYLYAKELLLALEADLENASTTLLSAKEKSKQGVFAMGDVSQAKTHFIQAKILVIQQKRAVSISFSKLAKDAGLPANLSFSVQPLPEKIQTDSILNDIDSLVEKAQKDRFDLQAAIANVAQKKADLNKAYSLYYPNVAASFDLGKDSYSHNIDEDYHWALLFKLELPIFQGFFRQNEVREKKANLEKSAAELLHKELSVISEVNDAHASFLSAKDSLGFSEEYVKEATLQYKIALENYRFGTSTILDVLSAQSSLADARAKLAEAKKNWYQSIADIAYATGALGKTESCSCEPLGVLQ